MPRHPQAHRCRDPTGRPTAPGRPRADLAVRLNAPDAVRAGTEFTYTVTVTNAGPFAAEDLVVSLDRPRGAPVTGASPDSDRGSPARATWRIKTLGAGQQRFFHITVRASHPSTVTATAAVASRTKDPNGRNDSATATTRVTGRS
ncbi:DUF11 domain-containing protein [Streptomyces sp. NBC_01310]|uniref:DUF11 domain-containing protein n=1 Tax=Streptomyces sp. NBC_01310 TaxID=2903820 RepID=UPI0035B5DD35|nr:DUF11 domain-containing protein [Streptomyces sp. NBC_01310]